MADYCRMSGYSFKSKNTINNRSRNSTSHISDADCECAGKKEFWANFLDLFLAFVLAHSAMVNKKNL